jgi:hypothetical protein
VEPRCPVHPDRPAAGTCQRCGAFACAEELSAPVAGRSLCAACGARPDADYLEAFRLKYWGRRDAFTWLWATAIPFLLAAGIGQAFDRQGLDAAPLLAIALAGAISFFGRRWSRPLVFVVPAAIGLWAAVKFAREVVRSAPGPATVAFLGAIFAAFFGVLPLLIAVAAYRDARRALFFRVPLRRERLQKAWNVYANNSAARTGWLLSLSGLIIPGLGLLGLALSWYGLTRVDPAAHPPIGRKRQAIAGVVLGSLDVLGWGTLFALQSFAG